jgi:hypothetical protein
MIGWLVRVLWGCVGCKFVQVEKHSLYETNDDKRPSYTQFIVRCEKCGRMKEYRF